MGGTKRRYFFEAGTGLGGGGGDNYFKDVARPAGEQLQSRIDAKNIGVGKVFFIGFELNVHEYIII